LHTAAAPPGPVVVLKASDGPSFALCAENHTERLRPLAHPNLPVVDWPRLSAAAPKPTSPIERFTRHLTQLGPVPVVELPPGTDKRRSDHRLAESNSPTPLLLVGIHPSQAEDSAIADAARPEDVGLANNAAQFNAQFIEDFKKLRQSH